MRPDCKWYDTPTVLVFRKWRQRVGSFFLRYIVNSRLTWVTLANVSKNQKKKSE